jgi:hypothetical protein
VDEVRRAGKEARRRRRRRAGKEAKRRTWSEKVFCDQNQYFQIDPSD